MLANEGVQQGGDPYGIHIDLTTNCINALFSVIKKTDTPILYPLQKMR